MQAGSNKRFLAACAFVPLFFAIPVYAQTESREEPVTFTVNTSPEKAPQIYEHLVTNGYQVSQIESRHFRAELKGMMPVITSKPSGWDEVRTKLLSAFDISPWYWAAGGGFVAILYLSYLFARREKSWCHREYYVEDDGFEPSVQTYPFHHPQTPLPQPTVMNLTQRIYEAQGYPTGPMGYSYDNLACGYSSDGYSASSYPVMQGYDFSRFNDNGQSNMIRQRPVYHLGRER